MFLTLVQAPLQIGKRLHWRKVGGRPMCVGFPCALLTHQDKSSVTKLSRFNNAIIFCIMFCAVVNPWLKAAKI